MQQATLAIRAHVPLDVLGDTIQPFPTFSEIYVGALKSLRDAGCPGSGTGRCDGDLVTSADTRVERACGARPSS